MQWDGRGTVYVGVCLHFLSLQQSGLPLPELYANIQFQRHIHDKHGTNFQTFPLLHQLICMKLMVVSVEHYIPNYKLHVWWLQIIPLKSCRCICCIHNPYPHFNNILPGKQIPELWNRRWSNTASLSFKQRGQTAVNISTREWIEKSIVGKTLTKCTLCLQKVSRRKITVSHVGKESCGLCCDA
jgi:hypothetical protein